ncbi:MAG: hypothetical protein MJ147_06255 [Clostridia bacterium]|nr:hypothetical protein [Clostridia bacterium]
MIQGVNHQVVEVTRPGCEYFERVIFFIKPEFSSVSQGTLRERASSIAGKTGSPPPSKIRADRLALIGKLAAAAITGAAIAIIVTHFAF